ncbi:MAG TPA: hypothetical protein VNI20_08855, partial [Fimbriimonadaceae bacterium]|nr:hypothetical protein [Fimbriimonadaceae bacterium]
GYVVRHVGDDTARLWQAVQKIAKVAFQHVLVDDPRRRRHRDKCRQQPCIEFYCNDLAQRAKRLCEHSDARADFEEASCSPRASDDRVDDALRREEVLPEPLVRA